LKTIEAVSIIGLGGIGSAYLAEISSALPMGNIRVIAGAERGKRFRESGVTVNGRRFMFPIYEPAQEVEPADLMIFAVKCNHLKTAIEEAHNHIGPGTIILSLLNGVTSEEEISAAYEKSRVLYSFVLNTNAIRNGLDTTYGKLGTLPFGEAQNTGSPSEDVRRVAELFGRAGIPYDIPNDMIRELWKKFMLNVGANQVSAVFRCGNKALWRVESIRNIAIDAMKEVAAVSEAENTGLTAEDLEHVLEIMERAQKYDGRTSMLQDVEAGRHTEVEYFGGIVLKLAASHGIAAPVNEMLVRVLRAYEDMLNCA
jgi:2-dehydropantoate 2-reductase